MLGPVSGGRALPAAARPGGRAAGPSHPPAARPAAAPLRAVTVTVPYRLRPPGCLVGAAIATDRDDPTRNRRPAVTGGTDSAPPAAGPGPARQRPARPAGLALSHSP
jgi:hypothetical protein